MIRFLVLATIVFLAAALADDAYRSEIEQWRKQRLQSLMADDGWLTVAGLFWLKEGPNTIGNDPANDILLPESAPANVGTIEMTGAKAKFTAAPGVPVAVNGQAVQTAEVASDADGKPDVISVGSLKLTLLKRGNRYAIRLRDPNNPLRKNFAGLQWFPVDETWHVNARFVAYPEGKTLSMDNIVGEKETYQSPGYVEFEHEGQNYRLEPAVEGDQLFFVIRDKTSGRTTYGGARFLYADLPKDGRVLLDFNKARNPPCAYNPYTTCPIAPPQNRLGVAVNAGEKKYSGAH